MLEWREMGGRSLVRWFVLALLTLACRSGTSVGAGESAVSAELERGVGLVEQGELEAGIEVLRAVLEEAPEDPRLVVRARSWIAVALTRAGDPEGTLRECQLALELAPEDPWLHYACGIAWYMLGELERARESFTHGIASDPRHIKCLQWRALVLRDLDEDRAAVEDLTRALECIESADEATLTSWGGDRPSLLLHTLNLRLQAFDDLGMHDAAMRDRERYHRIDDGSTP
jgi:tetratricopeptide (TPR) repeat protein